MDGDVLERGDIYFLYRPRVGEEDPEDLEDVQRFSVVLRPEGRERLRRLIVGRKQLPEVEADGQDRYWAFVEHVTGSADEMRSAFEGEDYGTETRGERHQPASRPAGEGRYAVVEHGDHSHLTYALELPDEPGEVQEALDVEPKASYVAAVKNPEQPSQPGAGLGPRGQAEFPEPLAERFGGRRFAALDPRHLDHEGAELVLITAGAEPEEELGFSLDPEHESRRSSEIVEDIGLDLDGHRPGPLFEGEWD